MKLASRLERMGQPLYAGLTKQTKGGAVWNGEMRQASKDTLTAPLRRRKPTTYFVNSMSDLFHENVPIEWIIKIFAVMALSQRHTYQVLTKRTGRMRAVVSQMGKSIEPLERAARDIGYTLKFEGTGMVPWPLPNVWLGTSTERQPEANERIPLLLQTPAAVRFISAEPLLGGIQLHPLGDGTNALTSSTGPNLDWVIVGGESGQGHRWDQPQWYYSLLHQCQQAGVPFFMKQLAGRKPIPDDLLVRQFPA
jgi:protein gp37